MRLKNSNKTDQHVWSFIYALVRIWAKSLIKTNIPKNLVKNMEIKIQLCDKIISSSLFARSSMILFKNCLRRKVEIEHGHSHGEGGHSHGEGEDEGE